MVGLGPELGRGAGHVPASVRCGVRGATLPGCGCICDGRPTCDGGSQAGALECGGGRGGGGGNAGGGGVRFGIKVGGGVGTVVILDVAVVFVEVFVRELGVGFVFGVVLGCC